MALSGEGMSPADVMALSGNGGNGGMWGENGLFWVIILFLFAFGGWGGRGIGGGGVQDNYVLTSDFAQVERKLDGLANGLCDGFYTQAQLINGVQGALATQGYETRNAITQGTIAGMQNANALQAQIAQCCCDNRAAIADVNYNMATHACSINYANANNTRDVIDNQNANARAILDAIKESEFKAMQKDLDYKNQRINALELAASQAAQNSYLIGQLRPAPVPAFCVPAPYQYGGCNCSC